MSMHLDEGITGDFDGTDVMISWLPEQFQTAASAAEAVSFTSLNETKTEVRARSNLAQQVVAWVDGNYRLRARLSGTGKPFRRVRQRGLSAVGPAYTEVRTRLAR